jgi:hypothetical protein
VTNTASLHLGPFTGVAARASVWASTAQQTGLSLSRVLRFQPARWPYYGTSGSANWGEYHLRLERVVAERCLAKRAT